MAQPNQSDRSSLQRAQLSWPALLALYLLSPLIAEMLTGSTPPLMFINPITFLALTGLYGSGAILVHELVRRRGLGWGSIFLLGCAYGILEEGLVVTSWFNPYWPDLGKLALYGRVWNTSWVWATELTVFHAVVSITIPIALVELLFPRLANRPWLSQRGFNALAIWMGFVSLVEFVFFAFIMFHSRGYTHPPLMYFGALLLVVAFLCLGLSLPAPKSTSSAPPTGFPKPLPGLWTLRITAFLASVFFFFIAWVLPNIIPWALVPILLIVGLTLLALWFVVGWSSRPGWNAQHRLALISGVLAFFILLSPLVEFVIHPAGKNVTGMALVGLACLIALIVLALSIKRRSADA